MSSHRVTAQDLYNFTKCAHRVFLDANGNPAERSEVSSFVQLLWELGLQIEREYISAIADHEIIDLQSLGVEQAFEQTLIQMRNETPVIYQGCVMHEHFVGRPDLLIKRDEGTSRFGSYCYEPIDIKAGRGWENVGGKSPKFKKHYAFQILFYRMLLERIQGTIPLEGRIINVDKEIEVFDPAEFQQSFHEALNDVEKIEGGQGNSEPVLGSHCTMCAWFSKCHRWVMETSDPTGLFFIGNQKFSLKEVGLRTINDIANMDVEAYLHPPHKIPRMGKQSLTRMKNRAEVLVRGKPEIRPGYYFPSVSREIYFDIEDDPTRGVTYLYGMVILEGKSPGRYVWYLAKTPGEEEQAIRDFWQFIEATDDVVYYVYSHKERTTLKHLMEKYGLDQEIFEKYRQSEYDLYQHLVVEYSDWPTFSYGIKHIAKYIGFKWRDPDPSGANSISWYNEYLANSDDQALLERILEYNEDDCWAMVASKRYFERAHRSHHSDA